MGIEAKGGAPLETTTAYLDQNGVAYEVIEHDERFTAAGEARAAGVEPENAAKTLLLRDAEGYELVVMPASERLDLKKVRKALDRDMRLATEQEMEADFGQFELGALPPLGPMLPAPELVDPRTLDHDRILCNAGDHRHSVLVDPRELVRVGDAKVADVCED
jgi:prolyl-tRNA editing enzyme YbaK/EbsC (Cys-tRNA(Pro) deacylase)